MGHFCKFSENVPSEQTQIGENSPKLVTLIGMESFVAGLPDGKFSNQNS
jgi:hypothetical protein